MLQRNEHDDADQFLSKWVQDGYIRSCFKRDPPKIKAMSSGCASGSVFFISVNGQEVQFEPNREGGGFRGIAMATIDPVTHDVVYKRVFDTHGKAEDNYAFLAALKSIEDDFHIAVFVAIDEATEQLNDAVVKTIKKLGSAKLSKLRFREPWAFIAQKQKKLEKTICTEMSNKNAENSFAFVHI